MLNWMAIAVGGGIGSLLRFALQGWIARFVGSGFPMGTLVVNVSGCLLIGLLAGYFSAANTVPAFVRLGLTVGLLGGFTTFSTYGLESYSLLAAGQVKSAVLSIILSNAMGLLAVWIGNRVGLN